MHILFLIVSVFFLLTQSHAQDTLVQTTDRLVQAQKQPPDQRRFGREYSCSFGPGSSVERAWYFTDNQTLSGDITEIHRKQSWPDDFELVFHLYKGQLIRADVLLSDSVQARFYYQQQTFSQPPFHGFTAANLAAQSKAYLTAWEQRLKKK